MALGFAGLKFQEADAGYFSFWCHDWNHKAIVKHHPNAEFEGVELFFCLLVFDRLAMKRALLRIERYS